MAEITSEQDKAKVTTIDAVEPLVVTQDEISRIIKEIPSEPDRRMIEAVITERRFSGPLPPPEFLFAYKEILPGSPERILSMAEREQQHRHETEKTVVNKTMQQRSRGQWLGFSLALFFGVAALIFGLNGEVWLSGIFGTTTVISLAIIFALNQQPSKSPVLREGTQPKDEIEL